MSAITEKLESVNLIASGEQSVARANFADINRHMGIASSIVTYIPFAFGKPADNPMPNPYRQFFYDGSGRVIKRFDFAATGEIDQKKTSSFAKIKGQERIVSGSNISSDGVIEEAYQYDDHGRLIEYALINPRWPVPKKEKYEYDKFGRKCRKVSYGLIGEPYLITQYLYDTASAKDRKVTYRYVTDPDGELILTILWTYDEKKEKQTGMYSFDLAPEEITELRKSRKDWELRSTSRSLWQYDKESNHIGFEKDVLVDKELNMVLHYSDQEIIHRVVTEKYMNEYEKLPNGKQYLARTIEWLTQMDEPLQGIKQYQYFDKDGVSLYPPEKKV